MTLRLHNFSASPNCRKVRALAIELGIELESVTVDLTKGANKEPAFLAKNPNGKVPVLEEDGWYLWESGAIMQYLADKRPEKGLYPTEPRLRADVNKWLSWDGSHLAFESAYPIYFERIFGPMMKVPSRPEIEKNAVENFKRFAAVVNGALEGKKYLVGEKLSLADFAVTGTMMFRDAAKLDLAPYPHLKAYLDRIEQRDSWKRTAPPPMG